MLITQADSTSLICHSSVAHDLHGQLQCINDEISLVPIKMLLFIERHVQ